MSHRHSDMSLQDQRVVAALLRRRLAEADRTGDVRRAMEVITARIDQQQAILANHRVRLLRGAIMDHRTMRGIAGDGGETLADKILLPTPMPQQDLSDIQLRQAFTLSYPFIQFREGIRERHAILPHREAKAGELRIILASLQQSDRRGLDHLSATDPFRQGGVRLGGVNGKLEILRQGSHV